MPLVHLTNWSSRKLHGPAAKFTIMARPRAWEHGDGVVELLTPTACIDEFSEAMRLRATPAAGAALARYQQAFVDHLQEHAHLLAPQKLIAQTSKGARIIASGDTLCCACSVAQAAAQQCHRAWAAVALQRAGWSVVLDGRPLL